MKTKNAFLILIICLVMLVMMSGSCVGQTVKWKTKQYTKGATDRSIDLIATIKNTLQEPCYIMISQAFYVNPDSLDRAINRKFFTPCGDFCLNEFIGGDGIKDKNKIFIPETFVKKLDPKEKFQMVVSTTSSQEGSVKEALTKRLLIAPQSVMLKLRPYFELDMQNYSFYKYSKVTFFWKDLDMRCRHNSYVWKEVIRKLDPMIAQPEHPSDPIVPMSDCEIPAEYPGGENEFMHYFSKNHLVQSGCFGNSIPVHVIFSFVIEKDGSISTVKLLGSLDESITKEVTRVLQSMPKWAPAQWRGQKVRSRFFLPMHSFHHSPISKQNL